MTKAKRGDLVAIVTTQTTHTQTGVNKRQRVDIEEVAGITREGLVRTTKSLSWGDNERPTELKRRLGLETWRIIPAGTIDVAKVKAIVRAHTYPSSDTPKSFDSLEEAKEALRPALAEGYVPPVVIELGDHRYEVAG